MYAALLVLHLIICFALIGVVLIQSGKGGGLAGGAFGGSAQTVFGGRGATDFVTKATMVLAAAFFITSMSLALMSSGSGRGARSLIQSEAQRAGPPTPQGTGRAPAGAPAPGTAPSSGPSTSPPAPSSPSGGGTAPTTGETPAKPPGAGGPP